MDRMISIELKANEEKVQEAITEILSKGHIGAAWWINGWKIMDGEKLNLLKTQKSKVNWEKL